jgi:hypothetical protein
VRQALSDVQPSGDTSLVDGAYAAIMLDRRRMEAGNLLLVFSDGLDTIASWLTADRVLDSAKRSDFVAYGVSARGLEESKFLEDLTELTGGRRSQDSSPRRSLSATFLKILDESDSGYLISYSPTRVSQGRLAPARRPASRTAV